MAGPTLLLRPVRGGRHQAPAPSPRLRRTGRVLVRLAVRAASPPLLRVDPVQQRVPQARRGMGTYGLLRPDGAVLPPGFRLGVADRTRAPPPQSVRTSGPPLHARARS